jgi:DNA-binding transcriptional regulator PaaX
VSFDVPNRYRNRRDVLRSSLKEAGFYQLQKSVWIAPYEMTKEFWKFVVTNGLHKYCKVMLIEVLEGDEGLRRHFKLAK